MTERRGVRTVSALVAALAAMLVLAGAGAEARPAVAEAAVPGIDSGQWTAEITFAECVKRAANTLRSNGFSVIKTASRVFHGFNRNVGAAAVITCYYLGDGRNVVTITVAAVPDSSGRHSANAYHDRLSKTFFGAQPAELPDGWAKDPREHRGKNGERFSYRCEPTTPRGRLWGTDLYTDDSTVCLAAVHAGVIDADRGGNVTIEIRPGVSAYTGSTRNGVTSSGYGAWGGSFVFVR